MHGFRPQGQGASTGLTSYSSCSSSSFPAIAALLAAPAEVDDDEAMAGVCVRSCVLCVVVFGQQSIRKFDMRGGF